jgi:excisionase family DNA binding protein
MDPIILTSKEELQALIRESYRALREGEAPVPAIITIDPQPLLTVDEAVDYLRISKNTLYGYTSQGRIPHIKQGKRVLFRKSQLDAWLDAKQRGTAQ